MSGEVPPRKEAPILIEYPQQQDHYYYDESNETIEERRPLEPLEVWMDAAALPASPPAQTAFPGTASGVVSGISGVVLTAVPGSTAQFESLLGQFLDMVPANYNGGAYQPALRDALGATVPYNPSVWVADGLRRVVEFKYRTPAQLGYTPPLAIDYWRYTGLFPGTISGGINLGSGAQVFKDVLGPDLRFRTLTAGPGLSIGQDVPTLNEIMLSADEVTPGGLPAVPPALNLFVSTLGNDTTGAGTAGSPFLTLQRAFRDIRVIGYNNTAVVTILASGGTFALTSGVLALGQGTRGLRAQPVEIRGERAVVIPGQVITAVSQDAVSGLIEITVGAPAGFLPGQIVRFTSGPLAAFTPIPVFPPAPVELFIGEVIGGVTLRLPFALAIPAIGNTFEVLDITSLAAVTGITAVRGGRLPLNFRNLRIELNPVAGLGALMFQGSLIGLVGVSLTNFAPSGEIISVAAQVGVGRAATVLSNFQYSTLGMFMSNPTPGNTFVRQPLDSTSPFGFANSVFRGNGVPNNLSIGGNIMTLSECYFASTATISVEVGVCSAQFLWFEAPVPGGSRAALEVQGAGVLLAGNVRVASSAQVGIAAGNGGQLDLNNATLSGCVAAGLVGARACILSTNNLTLAGNVGYGLALTDGARLTDFGVISAAGASSAADGIFVTRGAVLRAGGVTATGNAQCGLRVDQASAVYVGGTIVCQTNGTTGIILSQSQASAGTVDASLNTSFGLDMSDGALLSCGDLTASGNGASGVFARSLAVIEANGTNTFSSNANYGADVSEGASLSCGGLTASLNVQSGLLFQSRALLRANDIVANGNGQHGLELTQAAAASGNITADGNAQSGLFATDADVAAGSLSALTNPGAAGAFFNRSTGRFNSNVTVSGNGGVGGSQLSLQGGSRVAVAGDLADPGPSAWVSVSVQGASELAVGGALAVANSGDIGLNVRGGARVVVGGILSLAGTVSGTAAAFVAENSAVQAGVLTSTGNAGAGFLLLSSSQFQSPNTVTCAGNGSNGFVVAEGSWAAMGGATCNGNAGAGLRVSDGAALRVIGTADCGANTGDGIAALNAPNLVLSALTSSAGANGGFGLTTHTGARVQTVVGNTMTGAGGDVVVGVNGVVPWATIDTKSPAVVTDYLAAQPVTEFCSVTN